MLWDCPKLPHLIPTTAHKLKDIMKHLFWLLRTSLCSSHCSPYFKKRKHQAMNGRIQGPVSSTTKPLAFTVILVFWLPSSSHPPLNIT